MKKPSFMCPSCKKQFTLAEADHMGSFCGEPGCADNMIILEKLEGAEEIGVRKEIGLGILICDVSGSMEDFAYKGRRVSKLSMVAGSAARGIWDLVEQMDESVQDHAYISIIYFSKDAILADDPEGKAFIKNLTAIRNTFSSAREFGDFLMAGMKKAQKHIPQNPLKEIFSGKDNTKNYTNLTSALELAHLITDSALTGKLADFGGPDNVTVIKDVCVTPEGESVVVPNIRCLIYSDGAHNYPPGSSVKNALEGDGPSLLITTFFGSGDSKGCEEMKKLASNCPKHGTKSFFLIDNAEEYQQLRGLFRMSSGVSGFCPNCMPKDT